MPDHIRLQTLLAATARKDTQAFSRLYELTSVNLFAVARRIVSSEAIAQDVLQDAYVQIWHRAVDFHESKGSPMAWMASIVRYRALDMLRKQKPMVSAEQLDLEQIDNAQGPMEKLLQSDMARFIWECLQELETKQRNSILMAFYDGLTHEDLASRSNTPLGTIKSWIRRGLQSVKRCLER